MFAVCNSAKVITEDVAHAMMEAFEMRKMSCEAYWTKPWSGALAVGKR
jgi:metal-sulfur cluster biosynthetic enzyme